MLRCTRGNHAYNVPCHHSPKHLHPIQSPGQYRCIGDSKFPWCHLFPSWSFYLPVLRFAPVCPGMLRYAPVCSGQNEKFDDYWSLPGHSMPSGMLRVHWCSQQGLYSAILGSTDEFEIYGEAEGQNGAF